MVHGLGELRRTYVALKRPLDWGLVDDPGSISSIVTFLSACTEAIKSKATSAEGNIDKKRDRIAGDIHMV